MADDGRLIYQRLYRLHASVKLGERGEYDQWTHEQWREVEDCLDQLWNRIVMLPENNTAESTDAPSGVKWPSGVKCWASNGGLFCTLLPEHDGPDHVAYAGAEVVGRWPVDTVTAVA
ncbi:hypothetical protein [Tsukamurella tyrosinosolvens]|uniref:hypothetical protein n=1 Tax=Tsukamurella tyrosinosolvens TaxID=57704 RepID=UPI002DD42A76|nr:hypothetical protein [Tsukamurella tyrosinosolvens]MEC4616319.1 hypothetical protein [Tsukamurella tyrosinosolvens]